MNKNPKAKGNQFERDIARQLSLWWTNKATDDVFWRTDSSGGRSTQRAKQGMSTINATGDIASRCADGDLLLKHFVIEIKRGYNKIDLLPLLDKPSNKNHVFIEWWKKLDIECIRDDAAWPMLIFKRDRAETCVAFATHFFEALMSHYPYYPHTNLINLHFKDMQLPDAILMNFNHFLVCIPGLILKEFLKKS